MIERNDLKPLQRQCLLAVHDDPKQRLTRARGGFATSDKRNTFTTRTVNGLEALGLLRVAEDMINAHAGLTAPGLRLAGELAAVEAAKAGVTKPSVIVYGPQGCGKTRNAKRLANVFGLDRVVDDWNGREPIPSHGALVLTNDHDALRAVKHVERYTFPAAMRRIHASNQKEGAA